MNEVSLGHQTELTLWLEDFSQTIKNQPQKFNQPPRALVVGGFVRDQLLGLAPKDADVEVYGLDAKDLEKLLEEKHPQQIKKTGQAFGVIKIITSDFEVDVSLPRRESKQGLGHRGFITESDPNMPPEEAARRRDFTINSLSLDVLTGEVFDFFDGAKDLGNKLLRLVDKDTFADDPLRVYRALQFTARLELTPEAETLAELQKIVQSGKLAEISAERKLMELEKLLLKSPQPSLGFELARKIGLTKTEIPELHDLIDVPQDPKWHPEGDVWTHTLLTLDEAAKIIRAQDFSKDEKLMIILGALIHDFGKPLTTIIKDGRIISPGHDQAGVDVAKNFLKRFKVSNQICAGVLACVKNHMLPEAWYRQYERGQLNEKQHANAIRRLLKRIWPVRYRVLLSCCEADRRARGAASLQGPYLAGEKFAQLVEKYRLEQNLEPLIQGRDIIAACKELNIKIIPGPEFGRIIDQIEELRDQGQITSKEQALKELKNIILQDFHHH